MGRRGGRTDWPAAALLKAWRVVGSKAWVDMVMVVVGGVGEVRGEEEEGGREKIVGEKGWGGLRRCCERS